MQKHSENDRAQADRDSATQALQKMDEARILLNRLMGPQGPMTGNERENYLPNKGAGEFENLKAL